MQSTFNASAQARQEHVGVAAVGENAGDAQRPDQLIQRTQDWQTVLGHRQRNTQSGTRHHPNSPE